MKQITFVCILGLLLACNNKDAITRFSDYEVYLQKKASGKNLTQIDAEIDFWKKRLQETPDDIISQSKIAGLLARSFFYSGNMQEVHQADSLYQIVNRIQSLHSSATFRSLAANCITQHQFQQASLYIDSAFVLGDDKYLTVLMEFDVALELGHVYRAQKALKSLADKNSFDYLIRLAKYKDHVEGDLNAAIEAMENAAREVEKNLSLYLWTQSNLGDMYGHANRIKESYQCYLDVLKKDPEHYHALKGIAWLAFSEDKNVTAARKILLYLQQSHPVPDYDLLLAEIAGYEKDESAKKYHLEKFFIALQNGDYGDMYNKYLFNLQADEWNNPNEALLIAQKEVRNRPTAEAYSWLAWAYLKNGNIDHALQIAKAHVEKKCFEPVAIYRLGMVYKTAGQKNKAKHYLKEAKSSSFELGPLASEELSNALNSF